MRNQIIRLEEKNRKVLAYTDEKIVMSSKGGHTFDSLMESSEKSGMLEIVKTIPIDSINELYFNEKDETFTVKFEKKGKIKKDTIQLNDISIRESLVSDLASLKGLTKNVSTESKIKPLLLNLIALVAVPIFTYVFRGMAIEAQNGEQYIATGTRRGSKQLIAELVEFIGPTGVVIIGVLAMIYFSFITYKRYNNPASEVTFK